MRLYDLWLVLCYLGYAWAASRFCKRQLKQFRIPEWLWIAIFTIGILLIAQLSEEGTIPYIMTAILHHGFIASLILMGTLGGIGKKMLVTVVLLLAKELVGHFSNSLFSCFSLVLLRLVRKEVTGIGWELDLAIGFLSFVVFLAFLWFLQDWFSPVFAGKPDQWYWLLSLPLFFLLFLIDIVNWGASNGIMVMSYRYASQSFGLYQNQMFSHIGICLVTALCFVIAGGVVLGMNQIYFGQKKQEQYRMQTSFYEVLTGQYARQERLRHDMKNHVLCLRELWNSRDWEGIGRYLGKMQSVGDLGQEEWTGNKVLDTLCHHKKKQAEELHISWMCDMAASFGTKIDEFDLCVLVGNLLDNALQAAERIPDRAEAFVWVQAQKRKKYSLLVIRNSTELKELAALEEGTGLVNVREMVEQYGGVLDMQLEASVFSVSVLLPETQPDMTGK